MKRCGKGIAAIYPQQSIREMTRTKRTPQAVMDDAMNPAENGWTDDIGADADHLKVPQDVDVTAAIELQLLHDRSLGRCRSEGR